VHAGAIDADEGEDAEFVSVLESPAVKALLEGLPQGAFGTMMPTPELQALLRGYEAPAAIRPVPALNPAVAGALATARLRVDTARDADPACRQRALTAVLAPPLAAVAAAEFEGAEAALAAATDAARAVFHCLGALSRERPLRDACSAGPRLGLRGHDRPARRRRRRHF